MSEMRQGRPIAAVPMQRKTAGGGEPAATEPQPGPDRGLAVDVVREDGDWSGCEGFDDLIAAAVAAVDRHQRPGRCEATVALCSDAHVRRLNASFRGKDEPTNVLSFPAAGGAQAPAGVRSIGDIALAAETVMREAREGGVDPRHHLQHLVVHGLLHLLGHDHETDRDADAMEAIEIEILDGLGIADPYAGAGEHPDERPTDSRRERKSP